MMCSTTSDHFSLFYPNSIPGSFLGRVRTIQMFYHCLFNIAMIFFYWFHRTCTLWFVCAYFIRGCEFKKKKKYFEKIYISYGGNGDCFIRGKRCQLTVCPDTCTDTFESSALCRPMRSDIQFCAFQSKRCTMPSPVQATYRWALHSRASKCHRNLNDTWRIDLSAVNKNIKTIYLVREQNKRS